MQKIGYTARCAYASASSGSRPGPRCTARSGRTTDPDEHERWTAALRSAVAPLFDESQRGRRLLRGARSSDAALVGELLDEAEALGIDLLVAAEEER